MYNRIAFGKIFQISLDEGKCPCHSSRWHSQRVLRWS